MTIEEILALGKMGYTKDDISALISAEKPEAEKPAEAIPEAEKPAEVIPEAEKPAETSEMDKLKKQLDYVITRMNYEAVKKSTMPEQHIETADDILASIIRNNKGDNENGK